MFDKSKSAVAAAVKTLNPTTLKAASDAVIADAVQGSQHDLEVGDLVKANRTLSKAGKIIAKSAETRKRLQEKLAALDTKPAELVAKALESVDAAVTRNAPKPAKEAKPKGDAKPAAAKK